MTGIELAPETAAGAPAPTAGMPRRRLRLPASRQGMTWLVVLLAVWLLLAVQFGRQVYLNWESGQAKSPEYLAINPMGKVPTIVHGGTVVTECAAICAYLADAFPQANLAPPSTSKLRGPYYRWLFFAAGPVESLVVNKALAFMVYGEQGVTADDGRHRKGLVNPTLDWSMQMEADAALRV